MSHRPFQLKIVLVCLLFAFSESVFASALVTEVAKEYGNLITWQNVQEDGNATKIRLADTKNLPSTVLDTLELLGLFVEIELARSWEPTSSYGIMTSEDIMEIYDSSGVMGYAINITECNVEECYGWDALYLDQNGYILQQTF